jgi:hypothetical protein
MSDIVDAFLRMRLRIVQQDGEALRSRRSIHPLNLRRDAGGRIAAGILYGQIRAIFQVGNHDHERRARRLLGLGKGSGSAC